MKKNLAILGSTGSIGRQALEVVVAHPSHFSIEVLTAQNNIALLAEQARLFNPNAVVIANDRYYDQLAATLHDLPIKVYAGNEAIRQVVEMDGIDLVLNALVGYAGMLPTVAAVMAGKPVALANKESLVIAGKLIMEEARKQRVPVIPVDSEHSAIFQCLAGESASSVEKIWLTASGGPFRGYTSRQLNQVTRQEALSHPSWSMGEKITIDSATLMNKGFEVIEAHWLFGVDPQQIDVIIHPQSVIHSIVQFVDGSMKAQMGIPDMRLPILYALGFPERIHAGFPRFQFGAYPQLTFELPDRDVFPSLDLAYRALNEGGTASCVLNAANEVAVAAFLQNHLPFSAIPSVVETSMNAFPVMADPGLPDYIDLHHQTIEKTTKIIAEKLWIS